MRRFLLFFFIQIVLYAQPNKKLLILHSYNQSYSWTKNIQNGIDSVFDNTLYEVHVEYMDTKRYHDIANFKNLVSLYKDKYKNMKFDAIIVSDNNAFSFFKFHREELFKDTPTIFCGINYLVKSDLDGLQNVTGINEKANILKNFQLIKKLHPDNKDVYVVVDTTATGNLAYTEINRLLETMPKDKVKYHILRGYSLEEVQKYLQDKNGVVLLTAFFRDDKQKSYEYYELVKALDRTIKQPLYGVWDINFGNGLIGGYLTSGFFQGKTAAQMAKRVLDGEHIDDIGVLYESPNSYMFDYKQMKKHGLRVEDLPKDYFIINYEKTFFEKNEIKIYVIMGLLTFLAIVIFNLLASIQKRKKAEKKLLESEKDLELKVASRTQELKMTIETLKKAQDKLVYSEKMSALGGLVAGVSHEINTPIGIGLTGITHFLHEVKAIKKNYEKEDLSQDEFEKFLENSSIIAELVHVNLKRSADLVRSFKQISVDQTSDIKRDFEVKKYTEKLLKREISFLI